MSRLFNWVFFPSFRIIIYSSFQLLPLAPQCLICLINTLHFFLHYTHEFCLWSSS